jgi:hypothetical protein
MSVLRNVSGNLLSFQEHEASLVGALLEIPCCDQLLLSSSLVPFLKMKEVQFMSTPCCRCVYVCVCVCLVCVYMYIYICGSAAVCSCVYKYLCPNFSRSLYVNMCAYKHGRILII